MTDERKKEISLRIMEIAEELKSYAREYGKDSEDSAYIDVIGSFSPSCNYYGSVQVFFHDGDRMVSADTEEDIKNILLIQRDDTVRRKKEKEEDNEAV